MGSKIDLSDLTKDKSDTIGFVVACLFASAIDLDELNQWAVSIVERSEVEEIPDYVFKLMEFRGPLAGIYQTIGFSPVWDRSKEEEAALYGIAIERGKDIFDIPISSESAVRSLEDNPCIRDTFNLVFPFIKI